jgi:hypothetical protein
MLDAFVDIPLWSWLILTPGVGYGTSKLTVPHLTTNIPFNPFKRTGNLWQYYLVFGFKIGLGLDVRLGIHENYGDLPGPTDNHNNSGATTYEYQPLKLQLTTLGVGYTF